MSTKNTPVRVRLDVEKAIQAAGVILRREGKRASRLRVLKLLYIADRISLEKTGEPILGSKIVAMKEGPLHSEVYDLIKGEHIAEAAWSRHFRNAGIGGRDLVLEVEPDVGRLSRPEIELLNSVVDDRAQLNDWCVADETHRFREWIESYPNPDENTSRPISLDLLLDSIGRQEDKEAITQDLKDSEAFDRFFEGLNE